MKNLELFVEKTLYGIKNASSHLVSIFFSNNEALNAYLNYIYVFFLPLSSRSISIVNGVAILDENPYSAIMKDSPILGSTIPTSNTTFFCQHRPCFFSLAVDGTILATFGGLPHFIFNIVSIAFILGLGFNL